VAGLSTFSAMARSRSPRVTRFSKNSPPTLKTWVLCRVGTSKWCDAVPALVSRVGDAQEKSEKGGVTVNVLAPNVLALQHSFGGGAYKELRDLPLQNVRPYHGKELQKLRDALMAAFRQQAKARAASAPPLVEHEVEDVEEETPPPLAPASIATREDAVTKAASTASKDAASTASKASGCASDLAASESAHASAQVQEVPLSSVERSNAEAAKPLRRFRAKRPASMAHADEVAVSDAPPTPAPSTLRLAGAPVTPECPPPAPPAPPAAVAAVSETKVGAVAALTKQRLRALTAVVAKAFQSARETTLTREELAAKAYASEAQASATEMDEALDRLSASGKVFLSSDLVFLL